MPTPSSVVKFSSFREGVVLVLKDLNHDRKHEVASSRICVYGLKDFNHDKECEVGFFSDCSIFSIISGSFLFQYDGASSVWVWICLPILLKGPDESCP